MSEDKQRAETSHRDRHRDDRKDKAARPQKQPSGREAKPGERGDQSRDPQGGRV
jgi:hypothetical protein